MRKYICFIILVSSYILILFCSSCRDWIINVDGYELHLINDKYYIAQIPEEPLPTEYVIPTKIKEYEIYGFGSNKTTSLLGGVREIYLPRVKKLYIPKEIKSIYLDILDPILIETELDASSIEWLYSIDSYSYHYFIDPGKSSLFNCVDENYCFDGLIYEEKEDGNLKVVFNYSDDFILHNEVNGKIVNEIANSSFRSSNIKSIDIPNNITIIDEYAFEGGLLENININSEYIKINDNAFRNCNINEINFNSIVVDIGNYAFSGNKLTSVCIFENINSLGNGAFSNNNITSFSFTNPNIKVIPDSLFSGNPLTGELDFGEVKIILENALSYNLRTELIIPDQIIEFSFIKSCPNLKKLVLPSDTNYVNVYNGLVEDMISLEELHLGMAKGFILTKRDFNISNLEMITVSDKNEYLYVMDGILYDKQTDNIIKFPASLKVYELNINTNVNKYAFIDAKYLNKVTINTELKEDLFYNSKGLETVVLNSNIKVIPDYTFSNCSNLKYINLDNIKEVKRGAFYNCSSLESANLLKCETVGEDAFKSCNLKEVKFTKNVIKLIKEDAFMYNQNLTECNYYNAIIEDYAFYGTQFHIKTDKEKEIEAQERKMWFYRLFGWLF